MSKRVATPAELVTVTELASELRTTRTRIDRAIERMALQPARVCGQVRLYPASAARVIAEELARVDRQRRGLVRVPGAARVNSLPRRDPPEGYQ